jgi:mannose-6-phosphate isomerase class I
MAFKAIDVDEIEPTWGTFRMVRHQLGGTAFGLNQIEGQSGQEEIYYTISGSGTLTIDGEEIEMRPGRYILVSPDAKRRPSAGPDGLSFLCVGGVPGGIYEPWAPPDE